MRIGILGGSFNPPHIGHLKIAKRAQLQFSLDKLLIIPCKTPVHKSTDNFATAVDRLYMCEKTFDFPSAQILDIEIVSNQESYTLYTLQKLKEIYKDAELFFIIGCDMLFYFRKWYKYKKLFKLATFIVFARETDSEIAIKEEILSLSVEGGKFLYVKSDEVVISSSEIRENLRAHKEYLTNEVYDYIVKNKVYKGIDNE